MGNSQVQVSVIIPTYNRKDDLCRAIKSVQDQTERNIEILICDDGSTDDTRESVEKIIREDSRVRYINCGHNGRPAIPRNIGIKKAKGDWLAFLDDDDVWNPTKLEAQLFMMEKYKVKACCTNAFFYDGDNNSGELYFRNTSDALYKFRNMISVNPVMCSSTIIHSSTLEECIGFPEDESLKSVGEDYAFWLRIAAYTDILYLHNPLIGYLRTSNSSIRKEKDFTFKQQRKIVFDDLKRWRKTKGLSVRKYYIKEYIMFCVESVANFLYSVFMLIGRRGKRMIKRLLHI